MACGSAFCVLTLRVAEFGGNEPGALIGEMSSRRPAQQASGSVLEGSTKYNVHMLRCMHVCKLLKRRQPHIAHLEPLFETSTSLPH